MSETESLIDDRPAIVWSPIRNISSSSPYWDETVLQLFIGINQISDHEEHFITYRSLGLLITEIIVALKKLVQAMLPVSEDTTIYESIPIAIAIPEGLYLPLAIFAIHLLNHPFDVHGNQVYLSLIPIEPTEGRERLMNMLSDSGPFVILTAADCDHDRIESILQSAAAKQPSLNKHDTKLLYTTTPTLVDFQSVVRDAVSSFTLSRQNFQHAVTSFDLQCPSAEENRLSHIVYTSGTTGEPKGCVSSLRSLLHYLDTKNQLHNIDSNSRVLLASALSFDPCLSDILATFQGRATLVISQRETIRENLANAISVLRVTHVLCTPTLWSTMADYSSEELPTLERVALGGEPIPSKIIQKWARSSPASSSCFGLYATYGVTEACVYQTIGEVFQGEKGLGQIVGIPFPGIGVILCDETNQSSLTTVSNGLQGEVILYGKQLDAYSSYLNKPKLTKEKFILKDTSIHYRSGDRGIFEPNGHLRILGRIHGDNMVKLHGVRIELGEVEASLLDDIGIVEDAIVLPRCDAHGSQVQDLIAYIIPSKKIQRELGILGHISENGLLCTPSPLLVLMQCRCQRKARATPSSFVFVSKIPMSPTGKRDRRSLPPLYSVTPMDSVLFTYPNKGIVEPLKEYGNAGFAVANQIIDCLNLQPCQEVLLTTKATFSMLGGDSLAATRIVRGLYALHFGVDNTRHLGGQYGVLDGAFAVTHLLKSSNLGAYVDHLDRNHVCSKTTMPNKTHVDNNVERIDSQSEAQSHIENTEARELYDALMQACMNGNTLTALGLLEIGADPNYCVNENRLGKTSGRRARKKTFRSSPLHLACMNGDDILVEAMLEKGARFNKPDASGLFPIHLSIVGDSYGSNRSDKSDVARLKCVKLLLAAGSPLAMKDGSKQTVLHCAARAGHVNLLRYLMDQWHKSFETDHSKSQSLDWRDNWMRTPVHWAVLNGHIASLAILIESGCSPSPPKPKNASKRSSVAIESPMEICDRLYQGTELGDRIKSILQKPQTHYR